MRHLHVDASLLRSWRHHKQYSRHAGQIAGHHRQLEMLVDPAQRAIHGGPQDGRALRHYKPNAAKIERLFAWLNKFKL